MAQYAELLDVYAETMPRADIARLQEARLMPMLEFTYERAPLIRETWKKAGVTPKDIRSLDDYFTKAPFINKDAIRLHRDTYNDPCGGLQAVHPEDLKNVGTTSGTTGDPTPLLLDPRQPNAVNYLRTYWYIGARPGDHFVMAAFTFRGGHSKPIYQEHGFVPILFSHSPAEVPRMIEAFKRYRPTVMNFLSNPLTLAFEQVFERSSEDPKEVFKSFKGVLFGGEPLGTRQKALTKSWGIEIFEQGAAVGDVATGVECRAHDGLHAFEDLAIVECLDPNGNEPVPDGTVGELVVTSLTDRFTPFIRCRTDDLVIVKRDRCICGRTHARVITMGRKGDQIIVNGRSILPREVQEVVEAMSETRGGLFQIIRPSRDLDRLRVRVAYDPTRLKDSEGALSGRLTEALATAFSVPVVIELRLEAELLKLGPPHKIPRVAKA